MHKITGSFEQMGQDQSPNMFCLLYRQHDYDSKIKHKTCSVIDLDNHLAPSTEGGQ